MKYALLMGTGCWVALAGVWDHDWRMIVAGVALLVAWPLLAEHVEEAAHERELLRDVDDLAESA